MSIRLGVRLGVTIVAANLLFWPASSPRAGESAGANPTSGNPAPTRYADLFRQAPIGHRQPRLSDMSRPMQATPADVELRRLDDEIDRKLIICRGC